MKISRLFEMVFLLMNKKSMSAKELAEYFEVSIRTIYRDVDVLSMAGIPIYATKGRNGGIALMDHYVLNKSLVSKTEQQKILTSLKSLSFTSDKEVSQTVKKLSAFFNIEEENWLAIDYQNWSSENALQFEFELFKDAILNSKQISFFYYGKNGKASQRIVNPYKVLYKGADWYVYAYCTSAENFRYFKLTRMQDIKMLDTVFTKVALPETEDTYERKLCEVVIKVEKQQAHRVLDEMKNMILEEGKDYFIAKITMDEEWLYPYLFGYLDMIEVVKPHSVREKMKEIAEKIMNKY